MAITVQQYSSGVDVADLTINTVAGSQIGWRLVVMHGWGLNATGPLEEPPSGDDWELITASTSASGSASVRMWTRLVTAAGVQPVVFPAWDGVDNHAHLWLLSGSRMCMGYSNNGDDDDSGSHVAPSVYSPDDTGLLLCGWVTAVSGGNYTIPGSMTAGTERDGAGGYSTSRAARQVLAAHGPTGTRTATFAPTTPGTAVDWAAASVAVAPMGTVTFPEQPLQVRAEIAPGADLTANPGGWAWTDISSSVDTRERITIQHGRPNEAGQSEASASLILQDPDRRFRRRNPESDLYGLLTRNTPLQLWVNPGSGWEPRFGGFIPAWPPRWRPGGLDRTVSIRAAGISRRLDQGAGLEQSPLKAKILTQDLLAYWTCEDPAGATSAGPSVSTVVLPASGDVQFAADSDVTGSDPVMQIGTGGKLTAVLPVDSGTTWSAGFVARIPSAPSGVINLCEWISTGSVRSWQIEANPSGLETLRLRAYDTTGARVVDLDFAGDWVGAVDGELTWGDPVDVVLTLTQNGADIDYVIAGIGPSGIGGGYQATLAGHTFDTLSGVRIAPLGDVDGVGLGHIRVLAGAMLADTSDELDGFVGERAVPRIDRITHAAAIPLSLAGVPVDVTSRNGPSMDVQESGTALNLVRDCQDTDAGLLWDHWFGFRYQTRAARYNASVALDLEYGQVYDLAPPDDDQGLRNDVTVTRSGGSTGRHVDQDSIEGDGRRATSITLPLYSDSQVLGHAQWRTHLGTVQELRQPTMTLHLSRDPDLILDWCRSGIGSRLQVDNATAEDLDEPVDVFVEGATEVFASREWDVHLNCVPARPYEMWEFEHDRLGRLGGDASTLDAGIDDNDTSLSVVTSDGVLWTTSAGDLPLDIEVGGERMTVSAIAGGSSPQTFTVTRSVNGVVKSHDSGAPVLIWRGGALAL